jgi:endo-1,4-beta-xylanase
VKVLHNPIHMARSTLTTLALFFSLFQGAWTPQTCQASPDIQIEQRIKTHRTATAKITVCDSTGQPLVNTNIVVRMKRHRFLFGCNLYLFDKLQEKTQEQQYRRRFVDLFNFATLPFYWGLYEPIQGGPQVDHLTGMAKWCRSMGIQTKGHPLVWHESVAPWQATMDLATLYQRQKERIFRDVDAFKQLIDIWDVVNEPVTMPDRPEPIGRLSSRIGIEELIGSAFNIAREANPGATLLLNDYRLDRHYRKLIAKSLKKGVPIDALGLQAHMHGGFWGKKKVWALCEDFKRLKKDLHWTEITIVSGRLKTWEHVNEVEDWVTTREGEKRQARQVIELYRILFSHPAVTAITWWDLSDRGAWQAAPAGLLRKDMTPKPAYHALKKLIKEAWWTPTQKLTTDETGSVLFNGFLGDYVLHAGTDEEFFRLDRPGTIIIQIRT